MMPQSTRYLARSTNRKEQCCTSGETRAGEPIPLSPHAGGQIIVGVFVARGDHVNTPFLFRSRRAVLATATSSAHALPWRIPLRFVNMFEVDSIDAVKKSVRFATMESHGQTHPKGGWQGGRGWQIGNASSINDTKATDYLKGGKWMIENFWEALDAENEYFYDAATQTLYLIPNSTDTDGRDTAPHATYVAVVLETLIAINGTKESPVTDVTIQGITFRDAADITMKPWGVRTLAPPAPAAADAGAACSLVFPVGGRPGASNTKPRQPSPFAALCCLCRIPPSLWTNSLTVAMPQCSRRADSRLCL